MDNSMDNVIQDEKRLLEVGDRLYNKEYLRWTGKVTYTFATVERLTETQAILSNGTRLINKPTKGYYDVEYGYCAIGKISKWYIVKEDVLLEAEKEKERQAIDSWFARRVFSREEKRIIYFKFKELDLLDVEKSTNNK